jgi:pyruvate dehydrogenase E1 component alpha subunit
VAVDGQDVFAVYETVREAVERARRGEGPAFIEAQTYRKYGHFEGDALGYRPEEEEEYHLSRDCLEHFRKTVLEQELLSAAELEQIGTQVREIVEESVRFARESPLPAPADTLTDVYVGFPEKEMWPFQTTPV